MVSNDLALEYAAVTMYNGMIEAAVAAKDNGTAETAEETPEGRGSPRDGLEEQQDQIRDLGLRTTSLCRRRGRADPSASL